MCIVSAKIKFCTCVDGAFEEDAYEDLPHYWLLHRFNKQKDLEIIGMPVMPLDFLQPNYFLNTKSKTFINFEKPADFGSLETNSQSKKGLKQKRSRRTGP
jgi:hypothetical protein